MIIMRLLCPAFYLCFMLDDICFIFLLVLMILVPRQFYSTKILTIPLRNFQSSSSMSIDNYDAMKYRHWVNANEDQLTDDSNKISIMTYNLLSRHYIWKGVYDHNDRKYLDWDTHRFPLINKTIKQFSCDIMCFQLDSSSRPPGQLIWSSQCSSIRPSEQTKMFLLNF